MAAWSQIVSTVLVGVGSAINAYGSYQGYKDQKKAATDYRKRLYEMQQQVEQDALEYKKNLDRMDDEFDPYDTTEAFASLYEGVILPLERDFEENIMPELQAAFGGGAYGANYQSGARRSAEADSRIALAEQKARLRYDERNSMIQRAYQDFDRRLGVLDRSYGADTNVTNIQGQVAQATYGSRQDTASARVAAFGAIGNHFTQTGQHLNNAFSPSLMGGKDAGTNYNDKASENEYETSGFK